MKLLLHSQYLTIFIKTVYEIYKNEIRGPNDYVLIVNLIHFHGHL